MFTEIRELFYDHRTWGAVPEEEILDNLIDALIYRSKKDYCDPGGFAEGFVNKIKFGKIPEKEAITLLIKAIIRVACQIKTPEQAKELAKDTDCEHKLWQDYRKYKKAGNKDRLEIVKAELYKRGQPRVIKEKLRCSCFDGNTVALAFDDEIRFYNSASREFLPFSCQIKAKKMVFFQDLLAIIDKDGDIIFYNPWERKYETSLSGKFKDMATDNKNLLLLGDEGVRLVDSDITSTHVPIAHQVYGIGILEDSTIVTVHKNYIKARAGVVGIKNGVCGNQVIPLDNETFAVRDADDQWNNYRFFYQGHGKLSEIEITKGVFIQDKNSFWLGRRAGLVFLSSLRLNEKILNPQKFCDLCTNSHERTYLTSKDEAIYIVSQKDYTTIAHMKYQVEGDQLNFTKSEYLLDLDF
jgi:hypothetical protein